ncbi:PAS domain S-box-containing protein/diguanylate cyclase (GGDEF)-like protein [Mesorhizobium sp. USDA 4775]|uniref:putative bifunctional diguanylate cyclase/phosphodiesterase n=1 Tax=Mesorhizobium jarvisii TaxID=1777867 RepID=UPI00049A4F1F|nr:GGDEF domain-containing phosphodiesterase [Mesorhizobium jarvisii]AID31309.1 EAL domain-containing protein [Mesorhizobium huakuii 7653R]MCH4554727.1 EAL domain-containing protein [Mesorhizobium jarvisii]
MTEIFKAGFGNLIRSTAVANPRRYGVPQEIAARLPDLSRDGLAISDLREKGMALVYVNRAFQDITGYSSDELIGRNCRFLQGSDRLQPEIQSIREAIARREDVAVTLKNYRKDGSWFWNELRLAPMSIAGGEPTHYIGLMRDVTASRVAAAQIAQSTRADMLTGVLNRYAFVEDVDILLRQGERPILLVKIDMARFHDINEGYGYDVGDQVLMQIARRLTNTGAALICRTGSNEFALAQPLGHADEAQAAIEMIRQSLAPRYLVAGATIRIRFAMGYVVGNQTTDAITLVRRAGAALHRSKSSAFLDICAFSSEDDKRARNRLRMTSEMQQALEHDEFDFHYQPQVDLATGTVVGAEALLRWHHGLFGMQSPDKFIGHAEDTGLILDIGARGLRTVADFAARVNRGRQVPIVFSFNVSPLEFKLRDMPKFVSDVLTASGADAAWIKLELTESLMVESSAEMLLIMRHLRELGVGLSIDDFGTGYANLRYLEDFPLTEIKIDRDFVKGLAQSRSKRVIIESIIRISRELGFHVVAEGIETEVERTLLRDMDCDFGQGFLLGRPVDAARFESLV